MDILILSRSHSFEQHVKSALEGESYQLHLVSSRGDVISRSRDNQDHIVLAHISSCRESLNNLLMEQKETGYPQVRVGVAADKPELREMLALSRYGIHAYFNSYMADIHYRKALRHLGAGQTWYSPELLKHALELARLSTKTEINQNALNGLTDRERDVAMAVGQGMNNKKVAEDFGVSEHIVNMYLTRIFEKLNIKDQVALAIMLRRMY
ncbi:MAG: response regulator transcription factor [Gammaproteobacteria bacterium]|nr:MAG: response regulator transcription factor [Gammaproteobacteria bacterium]